VLWATSALSSTTNVRCGDAVPAVATRTSGERCTGVPSGSTGSRTTNLLPRFRLSLEASLRTSASPSPNPAARRSSEDSACTNTSKMELIPSRSALPSTRAPGSPRHRFRFPAVLTRSKRLAPVRRDVLEPNAPDCAVTVCEKGSLLTHTTTSPGRTRRVCGLNASAAYPNTVSSWKCRPTRRISLRPHAQWLASAARNLDDCFPGKRQHVTIGRNGEPVLSPAINGIFVERGGRDC